MRAEPTELLVDTALYVGGALGKLGQHVTIDVGDLGDAVLGLLPADTETAGQLRTQVGVIERGEGPLVEFDGAGVQSKPPTVRNGHPIGNHGVGVQLRVEFAAGVLTEHTHHDSLGIHRHHLAVVPHPGVGMGFDPLKHRLHRALVSLHHLMAHLRLTECEQDGNGLGGGEGGVVTSHRPLPEPASQMLTRRRIVSSHHRQEGIRTHLTVETQQIGASPPPAPRRLVTVEVVGRETVGVIPPRRRALQRGHPYRHDRPPHHRLPQVCTRLS